MVKLYFSVATGSWIVGKALAMANLDCYYSEPSGHQVLQGKKIIADCLELNKLISTINLIGDSNKDYLFNREKFDELKDWMRKHGRAAWESETQIVIVDQEGS